MRPVRTIECDVTEDEEDDAVPYEDVAPYRTVEVANSLVFQVIVAVVAVVEEAIEEITGAVVSGVVCSTSNSCDEYPPEYVKVIFPAPSAVHTPPLQEPPVMFAPNTVSTLTP